MNVSVEIEVSIDVDVLISKPAAEPETWIVVIGRTTQHKRRAQLLSH
jgi:hypothetical protein